MSETTAEPMQTRAALSRELSEFLIELSIGVHRHAMYPPAHPSLRPVVENIVRRLVDLVEHRRTLSIGVAQRQLVIEGIATDQRHPVLSDLARRLHDHQLGALSFDHGVTKSEVSALLAALAVEPERGGTPLGLLPADEAPTWVHAHLYRVGYDRLEIREGGGDGPGSGRATQLWLGLAQAALASETPLEAPPDASMVARSIAGHGREAAYDQVVVGYLLQLAGELKDVSGEESEGVRGRVSKLIEELDDATLARLIDFGGDIAQRRRFLRDASQTLAADAVVKMLRAAAASPEQSISNSMTRLLSKLAIHAETGGSGQRHRAEAALRANVESLIEGWALDDPNPEAYTNVLDAMSRAAPVFQVTDHGEGSLSGAERLVEMALEVDTWGPIVAKAVSDLAEGGGTGRLLEMIHEAHPASEVAARIREHLTTPSEFRRLLVSGQLGDDALRGLIAEMGSGAADPLLDVLAESDDRSVRRRVFDGLAGMGPFVAQRTVERLTDPRWFVLRNMLCLLARLDHVPEEFDPQPFMEHTDPRVRREAFPLALGRAHLRDRALVSSLADLDERMVRMALLELQKGVPKPVLPTLIQRVVAAQSRSSELRALAVKVLDADRSPMVVSALLELVTRGRTIFGKPRLAAGSAEVLQALRVLALHWREHPEIEEIVQQAARSKNADLRGSVRLTSTSGGGSAP